jgi:hypothetical protein
VLAASIVSAGAAQGCGALTEVASAEGAASAGCGPQGCFSDAAAQGNVDAFADGGTSDSGAGGSASKRNALCGIGACDPDNVKSCASTADAGPIPPPDAGGQGDAAPQPDAGAAHDGAAGSMGAAGSSGSAGDMGGSFGPSPSEGTPPYPGSDSPSGSAGFACQVKRESAGPVATCVESGVGGDQAPCKTSADCSPGFACVGTATIGTCQKYCCSNPEQVCPAKTYCAERLLRDDIALNPSAPLAVPVCVPAKDCDPLADANDPKNQNVCEPGLVCGIVRSDGTTGCVKPGKSGDGAPCPCAPGFVCSNLTSTCLKLCHTAGAGECSGGGVCQGGTTNLPSGFGICVGGHDS